MIDLSNAKVNKRVPKNRFKAELEGVDAVTWLYKISPDTVDIRQSDEIAEVQVFSVVFKGEIVNKRDLVSIQKVIPYPILFKVKSTERNNESYFMMIDDTLFESNKQFLDGDKLVIDKHLTKMIDFYSSIAKEFIQLEQRKSESIAQLAERSIRCEELEKTIAMLERKMNTEKQFDRQIEINTEIKRLSAELEETK